MANYNKEMRWIQKKRRQGVSDKELLHSLGMFSNKKKEKVMAQKGINSKEYNDRYTFLARVYFILSNK